MRYRVAVDATTGEVYLPVEERGSQLLAEPLLNKGSAFTAEEREALGISGLLPYRTSTMEQHLARVRTQWENKSTPLEKHIFMASLHDRNETLFHRFILENLEEVVPIVYTPTVAEGCRYWSRIFRQARGIYINPGDRGQIARVLRSRGIREAAVLVVTDNERILGIGDQGCGGMGIPIGKLALYTVAAGIHPSLCVPVCLDVGTNNENLLGDPLYLGWPHRRLRGEEYDSLIEEFVAGVKEVFPDALLQWEDFANVNSFRNLEKYRDAVPSFNDDIEGTAATVLASMLAAKRRLGGSLASHVYVIYGAGSAGDGLYHLLLAAMEREGVPRAEGRRRIFVIDSQGLIVEGRKGLDERKALLATDREVVRSWKTRGEAIPLDQVLEHSRATVLIGFSGKPGHFTESAIRAMAAITPTPIVMPLSNPTANAEATPEDILDWSEGRALVATGSPFPDVLRDGRRHRIGQANNMFIFPGFGLGVIVAKARRVTQGMFLAAADALADFISDDLLDQGALYPPITAAREVSHQVAHAVAAQALAEEVTAASCIDIEGTISQTMWYPAYLPYRPA
ncbi:MAG: NAD-dependent malic enzyme [Actinomycetota bacterium]